MSYEWKIVDQQSTADGTLFLYQRENDFIIKIDTFLLMNSRIALTEVVLGREGAEPVSKRPQPRVLVSGLGMGYTLRAALDVLPSDACVVVGEINPVVVDWCKGPMASLSQNALDDPRVTVHVSDVAKIIAGAANASDARERFDAIVLDLYQGTHGANADPDHPFFGKRALETTQRALCPEGILAVWTEDPDPDFEKRARSVGFNVRRVRAGRGGPRHVVYVATAPRRPR